MIEKLELRSYQKSTINWVCGKLDGSANHILVTSPTGTGKGIMELKLQWKLWMNGISAAILCTRISILRNYLKELGVDINGLSRAKIIEIGEKQQIFTYTRFRNRLTEDDTMHYNVIIIDECHHWILSNIIPKEIDEMEAGSIFVGFTATPFRGNGIEQREFDDLWRYRYQSISLKSAVDLEYWTMPNLHVFPFLDNSRISIVNGEFENAEIEKRIRKDRLVRKVAETIFLTKSGPAVLRVSSVDIAEKFLQEFHVRGINADVIIASTSEKNRSEILEKLKNDETILIQINVVSEGFDLPNLSDLYDFAPTNRPGNWMQFFGRLTRPYEECTKDYYCFCRNLEQHNYLLSGVLPNTSIRDIQNGFQNPWISLNRSFSDSTAEKVKRLKPLKYKTKDGVWGTFYNLESQNEDGSKSQYCIIYHPQSINPIVAEKRIRKDRYGCYDYRSSTKFQSIESSKLLDISNFSSSKWKNALTPKMRAWWHRSCNYFGLAPLEEFEPNAREFCILPVLSNLKIKLS